MKKMILLAIVAIFVTPLHVWSQNTIDFKTYNPPSTLVTREHVITRAKFPFIDIHNHQWSMPTQDISYLLKQMDSLNMGVMVNLSGRGYQQTNGLLDVKDNSYLYQSIDRVKQAGTNRIILFTNISFVGYGEPDWMSNTLQKLEKDFLYGAQGIKFYKEFGMFYIDAKGKRIHIDDPYLKPVWDLCSKYKKPVFIHSADPFQFWQEADYNNERLLEVTLYPNRKKDAAKNGSWAEIMQEQTNLFSQNPKTTFIAAHMAWMANDLAGLGRKLDTLPNMYLDIAAVIAELGRQPKAAKAFFERYQDRILFGKDSWVPEEYTTYFRLLETEDEYFPYHKKYHAFWRMYGLGLPDSILKKIYYKNALKIVGGINKDQFPD